MRGRAFAWVAVMLTLAASLGATLGAAQEGAEGALRPSVEPTEGHLDTTFTFRAGVEAETAANLLANGQFERNLSGWSSGSKEIGGGAAFSWRESHGDGHLEVEVPGAEQAGTVYAYQQVALPRAPAYEWTFEARGEGVTYAVLLRERGFNATRHGVPQSSWDAAFEGTLQDAWQPFRFSWAPRFEDSTHVIAYLRFRVAAGQVARVGFDDVALRPASNLTWDFDRDGAADAHGPVATWRFKAPGAHDVSLRHVRLDGAIETATVVARVASRPPEFELRGPATVAPAVPARFEIVGVQHSDTVARLANGAFREGLSGWTTRDDEIGGNASFEVLPGDLPSLRMRAEAPQRGTVYAYQTIPLATHEPLLLKARYRDAGQGLEHVWLLRERAEGHHADTVVSPPRSSTWRQVEHLWTPTLPNATHLSVYLRVRLDAGAFAEASFADVSLRSPMNATWSWSDGSTSYGTVVERSFDATGNHSAEVRMRDAWGAVGVRTLDVQVHHVLALRVEGDRAVRVGAPLALQARVHHAPPNLLQEDFSRGWSAWTRETGVDGAWEAVREADRPTARLSVTDTLERGSFYLHQTVPVDPRQAYRFQVHAASVGIEKFQYVLRETGFDQSLEGAPRETHDTLIDVAPASGGHALDVPWSPRYASTTHVKVYLRAVAPAHASAEVWFTEPRLVPVAAPADAQISWTGPGCDPCTGASVAPRVDAPGIHEYEVVVTSPTAPPVRERVVVLGVETPVARARMLDGGMLLRWETPSAFEGAYEWQDAQGRRHVLAPASVPAGALVRHEALVPRTQGSATGILWATPPTGDGFPLATFTAPLPDTSIASGIPASSFVRPWAPAPLRVVVEDPYVVLVEARLVDAEGDVVEARELAPRGEGVFEGEIPFAWGRLGRSFSVMLVASDASGASETIVLPEPVRVSLMDNVDLGRPGVWMVGLLALAAAGVGAWRRWGDRRGA